MGPSRTLILINGKRKNMSSLLYTQTSPDRGETGADISAIPTDAIERVEILRDGASAQYGSDAIAGVMNIILKDDAEDGSVTFRSGITSKGGGGILGISIRCKIIYVIFIIFVPWDESIYQYLVNQLNQPWNKVKRMAKHIPFVQNFT